MIAPALSPTNASQVCGKDSLAAMLATKRSAGVVPEVNLRERVTCMQSSNKAAHSGFETHRKCHQKSKTGVSVAPQKGLVSSKILKKNKKYKHSFEN